MLARDDRLGPLYRRMDASVPDEVTDWVTDTIGMFRKRWTKVRTFATP